jgi:hypothetical protein
MADKIRLSDSAASHAKPSSREGDTLYEVDFIINRLIELF